jgi:hypothetical protein
VEFFKGVIVAFLMTLVILLLLFISPSWPMFGIVAALIFAIVRLCR